MNNSKQKQKIRNLLHIKTSRSYKIFYGFNVANPRGRLGGNQETIKAKTSEDALVKLKEKLSALGMNDYYIISVEEIE